MSTPCFGPCGRDCNADQGHGRCDQCPGRPFRLPSALRPFGDVTLAVLLVACAAALVLLAGCGGGDPEDFTEDGHVKTPVIDCTGCTR